MEQKKDVGFWTIIVTLFCVVAGLGAGYSLKGTVAHIAGWQALVYALGAGIFIAISAVILNYALSSRDN